MIHMQTSRSIYLAHATKRNFRKTIWGHEEGW